MKHTELHKHLFWVFFFFLVNQVFLDADYGGLYLDADQWVLRSLDDLRRFPVTLGVEFNGSRICNAMFLAEPNASLLNRWFVDSFLLNFSS